MRYARGSLTIAFLLRLRCTRLPAASASERAFAHPLACARGWYLSILCPGVTYADPPRQPISGITANLGESAIFVRAAVPLSSPRQGPTHLPRPAPARYNG